MSINCSCSIPSGNDDGATFYEEKLRTAAKLYKCNECGAAIIVGEKYEWIRGMWDGRFATYRTCLDCLSVRNAMFPSGWTYEGVWEDVWEHIWEMGSLPEECLAKLTKRSRDHCCSILEDYWADQEDDDE